MNALRRPDRRAEGETAGDIAVGGLVALALFMQALDLTTWLAFVGPEREGNPAIAGQTVELVIAAKAIGILAVVACSLLARLALPLRVAIAIGAIGAASNVLAAIA